MCHAVRAIAKHGCDLAGTVAPFAMKCHKRCSIIGILNVAMLEQGSGHLVDVVQVHSFIQALEGNVLVRLT